jgi:predicted glycogen debranching enzyme
MEYYQATNDQQSWKDWLAPAAISVIESYIHGTDYDIRMAGDGLITAGSPNTQLTWMDAACDGVVFTPRPGKSVEINCLWYNALAGLSKLLPAVLKKESEHYKKLSQRVTRSFGRVFWDEELKSLRDHVWTDQYGVDHADRTLRPNQIFSASLPRSPLPQTKQRLVLKVVRDHLLTPYGLRTLPSNDPNYHGRYTGSRYQRDQAYHQGTIWPWLIGPYAEAVLRLGRFDTKSKTTAAAIIQPLLNLLMTDALGQVAEICEADPPHRPVGCIAQAWSVAEILRILALMESTHAADRAC